MQRDMDLVRLILLEIEKEYRSTFLCDLKIDGYDLETVAYHCNIMYEKGLISAYESEYGEDAITDFYVGHLTWEGHDFLEKVRDNSRWGKVKKTMKEKALPFTIDMTKTIADAFITAAAEAVVSSITGAK